MSTSASGKSLLNERHGQTDSRSLQEAGPFYPIRAGPIGAIKHAKSDSAVDQCCRICGSSSNRSCESLERARFTRLLIVPTAQRHTFAAS